MDYPAAKPMPADPSNYRRGRTQRANLIVIHCTDGHGSAENVGEMWQQAGHGSSAHFCVGQDGVVIQSVAIDDTAWHAHSANGYSVGVEHSARTPGEWGPTDPGLPPSDALYAASAALVAWLCVRLVLQPSRVAIVGHSEADKATTHTKCPNGCGWDWPRYMALVAGEYAKLSPVG